MSGIGQLRVKCCTSDQDFDISGFAPQSAYTPVVQAMKNDNANYAQANQGSQMELLRKEATLQGLTGVKVWDCTTGCYSKEFLADGGTDVADQYVDLLYLPFLNKADQNANKMLKNFVTYTGADKADGFGVYAWSAMIAFRDAVNAAVKAGGVNGVTRKTIFEQLNKIHQFNAEGMFGTIDLAGRKDVALPCTHAGAKGRLQARRAQQARCHGLRGEERRAGEARRRVTPSTSPRASAADSHIAVPAHQPWPGAQGGFPPPSAPGRRPWRERQTGPRAL